MSRKRTKRRVSLGLNPVEKAQLHKQWFEGNVHVQLAILTGDDVGNIIDRATDFYFVGACAMKLGGLEMDGPELTTIRAAWAAATEADIDGLLPPGRRSALESGMNAAATLFAALDAQLLHDASVVTQDIKNAGLSHATAFEAFFL